MKLHVLMIHSGYVEECSVGNLVLVSPREGFNSVEEAIESVAEVFLDAAQTEFNAQQEANERWHKCPHCGKSPTEGRVLDEEYLVSYIDDVVRGTADSVGGNFFEACWGRGWNPVFGRDTDDLNLLNHVAIIYEYGDEIIADVAFGGRTRVERGATGHEHRFDWESHIQLPEGMALYKDQ